MTFLIAALALSQCPGGVCPAPAARSAPAAVTYSYTYQSPSVTYQSSYSASGSPCANGSCTTQKRGLFKRLFRKA